MQHRRVKSWNIVSALQQEPPFAAHLARPKLLIEARLEKSGNENVWHFSINGSR
jgi:hypothetical protein